MLFPARCLGCDVELVQSSPKTGQWDFLQDFDQHWCRDCWQQLNVDSPCRCQKCGATIPQDNPLINGCSLCQDYNLRFTQAVAIGNYGGLLQELVLQMKNQRDEQVAMQLGNILAYQVRESPFASELDLVVPVPTHWRRRVSRGFQAAELVAQSVAKICHLPISDQIVQCLRKTNKQGTLSTTGRFKNVQGAFGLRRKTSVTGLTVLVVDDVMTSGATSSELARILRQAGASRVYVGVIARGARVS